VSKSRLIEGSSVESVVTCSACQNLPAVVIWYSTNIYAQIIKGRFKIDWGNLHVIRS